MGIAQGKKVDPTPLRLRRSRRSRPPARSSQREAVWLARPEQHPREKTWRTSGVLHKRRGVAGEEKETVAQEKAASSSSARSPRAAPSIDGSSGWPTDFASDGRGSTSGPSPIMLVPG